MKHLIYALTLAMVGTFTLSCGVAIDTTEENEVAVVFYDMDTAAYNIHRHDRHTGAWMEVTDGCIDLNSDDGESIRILEDNGYTTDEIEFEWRIRDDYLVWDFAIDGITLDRSYYRTERLRDGESIEEELSTGDGSEYLVSIHRWSCAP